MKNIFSYRVEFIGDVFGYYLNGVWRTLDINEENIVIDWVPKNIIFVVGCEIRLLVWSGPGNRLGIWYVGADDSILAHSMLSFGEKFRNDLIGLLKSLNLSQICVFESDSAFDDDGTVPVEWRDELEREWRTISSCLTMVSTAEDDETFPYLNKTLDPNSLIFYASESGPVIALPHPVTGAIVRIRHSFCLDDFRTVWPIPDEDGLYLCRAGHKASFVALFDARVKKLVIGSGDARWLAPHAFGSVDVDLYDHIQKYRKVLQRYIVQTDTKLSAILRYPPHIGHQLYNELGGLDFFIRLGDKALIPNAVLLGSEGAEVYGPVESIFPEMNGYVVRLDGDWQTASYERGLCATRLTTEYVSAALRGRIAALAGNFISESGDMVKVSNARRKAGPIILAGLRVENRTLSNSQEFLCRLASSIKEDWPEAILVVDGHNRRSPGDSTVFASGLACRRDPVEVEHEIASSVELHCLSIGLDFENLVGRTVAESVYWSACADVFIAPWGAGLAKYRWIGNCPGIILSSNWNYRNRSDFSIYHSPEFMESPSPVYFIEPSQVRDVGKIDDCLMRNPPDQPVESSLNFYVDVEDAMPLIRHILSSKPQVHDL